jgi:4-carboxymuconolactone decarboxylase|tara:strand:- start:4529 stop:5095 length:567 start_codon:yes stop_codon:yes gene_type:complete
MSRLSKKKRNELNENQQEQFDRICKFRQPREDGQIGGPFDPWIRSPELARRAVSFGNFVWERTTVDRGIVELAIIVTARYWRSNVEWVSHAAAAKNYGIPQDVIDSVFEQQRPRTSVPEVVCAYDLVYALNVEKDVPQDIYDSAVSVFGEQGVVELIAATGYYTMVAMTLNTFEIQPPADVELPFPRM